MSPKVDFVKTDTATVFTEPSGGEERIELLWGDRVEVLEEGGERKKVRARGRDKVGWVDKDALGGKSLLELYFIDVGQGDGILIKTPNGRHLMLDGGYRRRANDTGKSAADFVDWKFFEDYGEDTVVLDAMLISHCDADHYGGLTDLLEVDKTDELDTEAVRVKAFYHAGVGRWREGKKDSIGKKVKVGGETFITGLMGDRDEVLAALEPGADPSLRGEWRDLMEAVVATEWTDGKPTAVRRLSDREVHLPGFGPGDAEEPAIKVLGPVEVEVDGKPALRNIGAESINTNGNSLLLSLKFKSCRILLTGDLNKEHQAKLLADYKGREEEFLCDVGKACHHGSGEVAFSFLKAMSPAVTVISSGDNEGHDHPRPEIVAASAIAGHVTHDEGADRLLTPLVYSTELARSVRIGHPTKLDYRRDGKPATLEGEDLESGRIHYTETTPGDLNPSSGERQMGRTSIVSGLNYGLVNVRTDGEQILCATRDEETHGWRVEKTASRF